MIDPFEAVIALASLDTGIGEQVGGQVALQHRYGQDGVSTGSTSGDWPLGSKGLVMTPTPAVPQLYVGVQRVRAAVRCYGQTPVDCADVFRALVAWSRFNGKRVVEQVSINSTGEKGNALVYWTNLVTSPQLIVDDELVTEMPYFSVVLEAEVAEDDVP